jgi:hypothetical protein
LFFHHGERTTWVKWMSIWDRSREGIGEGEAYD